MLAVADLNFVRVALKICSIMPQNKCILMTSKPIMHLESEKAEFIEVKIYFNDMTYFLPLRVKGVISNHI